MNYIDYVNIKQGSKSVSRFSNGNTLPFVQRPFGFASFAPQTASDRGSWYYHPEDKCLDGIRLTHQPSPWIGDHGAILIHPQTENPYADAWKRWSSIDSEQTVLQPHYMKYYLNRCKATMELTPTEFGACIRMDFQNAFQNFISVIPVSGVYGYEYDTEKNRLYCYTDCNQMEGHDKGKTKTYFVFSFEPGCVDAKETFVEECSNKKPGLKIEGERTSIHLAMTKNQFTFSMATSYISYEQAERNLERDSVYTDFDSLKQENEKIWNQYLSRINIKADEECKKTFYSCMYRLFLYPHKAYELDESGAPIHYSPAADCVKPGVRYTDNGFWDTYRTVYPLFSLIAKEEYREILEGFIVDYIDGGWLPCWTAMDAKKCMPSTMIDAVIADAAVKGILTGDLLQTAFEGMEKHANMASPIPAYGRDGCAYYVELGYVPCDKHHESVNLTLDAAYGDYCLSVVANILGYADKAAYYMERSKNYKNIFDSETGFMRGKFLDGTFRPDFDPISWGRDYTEAAAWQTTFAVQHDMEGLAALYGGKDQLMEKLDEFFAAPVEFRVGGYGIEIHEMSEFAAGKWGQCAISNQPSFHIPFIYSYFGATEKTEYWVHRMCKEGFSSADDGFPGDEDNGTTAAWYIFATLGMYPLCPGKNEYVKFKGLAEEVSITSHE